MHILPFLRDLEQTTDPVAVLKSHAHWGYVVGSSQLLEGYLGRPLSSVTLAIRCMEEDNQSLSLLDLERLGKPSQSLVFGGRAFTHQRKMEVA